jgi:hypothetical protein
MIEIFGGEWIRVCMAQARYETVDVKIIQHADKAKEEVETFAGA